MPGTNVITQTGILALVSEAGLLAKLVLLLLLGSSVYCWAIIFTKWRTLKIAADQNKKFFDIFWNAKSLDEIISKSDSFTHCPAYSVFNYGVKELKKVTNQDHSQITHTEKVDNIYRALVRASSTEIASLEKHLGWLATTASAAPFVGLFGTVWGIMTAFQSIGASGAANLAVVAPGISEALITTAMGIGAAIPAVVGYNYFAGQIKKNAIELECFSQDFINILQRSLVNLQKRG